LKVSKELKGSIHQNGDTWYFIFDLGRDKNGKRNQYKRGGFKSKEEVEEAFKKAKENIDQIKEIRSFKQSRNINEFLKNDSSLKSDNIFLNVNEEELETLIIENIHSIEEGMTYLDRQVDISGGRIDILSKDKKGKLCVIEVKTKSDDKDLVYQCAFYPTQFKFPVRMISICPEYDIRIYEALKRVKNVELKKFVLSENNQIHISDYIL
jgi:RecB family endonuclease NucS